MRIRLHHSRQFSRQSANAATAECYACSAPAENAIQRNVRFKVKLQLSSARLLFSQTKIRAEKIPSRFFRRLQKAQKKKEKNWTMTCSLFLTVRRQSALRLKWQKKKTSFFFSASRTKTASSTKTT